MGETLDVKITSLRARLVLAEAVIEAARACYEADDFITQIEPRDGRVKRDFRLGDALAAYDMSVKR